MSTNSKKHLCELNTEQLEALNQSYHRAGLAAVTLVKKSDSTFGFVDEPKLVADKGWFRPLLARKPKVTIVIACHNHANSIAVVLASLQRQSWPAIQIILVDDASTDDSLAIAERFAAEDKRVHLVALPVHQGLSAAFNEGLCQASGSFVMLHSAKDWAHPELVFQLIKPLLNQRDILASQTHFAEINNERAECKSSYSVVSHPSVVLFRRRLINKLGFLDRVHAGYFEEYIQRIKTRFSTNAVISFTQAPLGIQLISHLLQQDLVLLKRYLIAADKWHNTDSGKLYLAKLPDCRAFLIPASFCRGTKKQREHRQLTLLKQSDLFDADWYLQAYQDVARAGMEPEMHYLRFGGQENRDPGPNFSSSGYRLLRSVADEINPLVHYLEAQEDSAADTQHYGCVQLSGQCSEWPDRPWLLVAAHAAGPELFGAERSLLDVLDALQALEYNVVVTLPGVRSSEYFQLVQTNAQQLAVMPYRWWRQGQSECQQTIQHFVQLMQQFKPIVCYCNTLVLSEPLHAARQLLIPGFVHVRELPAADDALCQQLGGSAEQIRQHLLALADGFIANSQIVADYLAVPERTTVIANVVDTARFAAITPRPKASTLRVGMISSNLPKKGLQDFVKLSQLLAKQPHVIECWLIGPDNEHTQQLKAEQAAGKLPASLYFAGYADSPEQALAPLDIVVNLSHFQESFGRTVLEAMAAGRVVVCYRWGALPELIEHEQTGLLVDFADVQAVANSICRLAADDQFRASLADRACHRAAESYSSKALQQQLGHWLAESNINSQEQL